MPEVGGTDPRTPLALHPGPDEKFGTQDDVHRSYMATLDEHRQVEERQVGDRCEERGAHRCVGSPHGGDDHLQQEEPAEAERGQGIQRTGHLQLPRPQAAQEQRGVWHFGLADTQPLLTEEPWRFYALRQTLVHLPGVSIFRTTLRLPIPVMRSIAGMEFYAQPVTVPFLGQAHVPAMNLPRGAYLTPQAP